MKEIQTLLDEVQSHLLRETLNGDLPFENRVFINSMLIMTHIIITHNSDVFNQVFKEALELEEAKLN